MQEKNHPEVQGLHRAVAKVTMNQQLVILDSRVCVHVCVGAFVYVCMCVRVLTGRGVHTAPPYTPAAQPE